CACTFYPKMIVYT
ncbi:hypothetical protein SOVF_109950, partial [Spinacia oleracea]